MNTIKNMMIEKWLRKEISKKELQNSIENTLLEDGESLRRDLMEAYNNKDSKMVEYLILTLFIADEKICCFCLNDYLRSLI